MKQGRRNDEGILTPCRSPKKGTPVQVLRRSTRKRSIPLEFGAVFATPPPSAKKSRKLVPTASASSPPTPVPTLTTLPYLVTIKLLLYLDVDTLERVSATCSYFDELIAGRFLTSIDFPFHMDFSAEVAATKTLEKKPLLKIKSKKKKDEFKIFPDMPKEFSEPSSIHKIIVDNCPDMTDYLVHSQLSLLSLDHLRELDLVPDPESIDDGWSRYPNQRVLDSYFNFDMGLLRQISRMGSLSYVTRLDVFVDHHFYVEEFMTKFPSLLELGLTVVSRSGLSKHAYLNEYLPRLASVVAASKAPVLKLNVVHESKRQVSKVLKNSFVEKLVVVGPCTLNLVPVMGKLKEVEVKLDSAASSSCTYWKSRQDDRTQHRAGLCCVNIGNLYENCPQLEKFCGVDVGSIPQQPSFSKWNLRIKKRFHQHYLSQGGSLEFKPWAKARWFSRRPVVQPVQMEDQIVQGVALW